MYVYICVYACSYYPVEINCEPLQDPLNGHMQVSGNRPGAVASYVCNPGFILIGHFRRSCELDGTFLGQAPICRREF